MIHGTFVPNYVILETEGACHLVKISGNFGLAVNGKRFVRSSQWKIPGKKGNSKKVGPFSWLERSERRSIYAFLVVYTNSRSKGKKKKKTVTASSQNKMVSLETSLRYHRFFFGCPLRMTRGTLEKLCRDIAATGSIPQGNRFGRPPIPAG